MMYSEFIEKTGYGESYMTYNDYVNYIEPVYIEEDVDKDTFCKRFYNLHNKYVNRAVELMVKSKTLEEKEEYINGDKEMFSDIEKAHTMLKNGFLKSLHDIY